MRRLVACTLAVITGCAPLLGLDDAIVDVDASWHPPDARIAPRDTGTLDAETKPADAPTDAGGEVVVVDTDPPEVAPPDTSVADGR